MAEASTVPSSSTCCRMSETTLPAVMPVVMSGALDRPTSQPNRIQSRAAGAWAVLVRRAGCCPAPSSAPVTSSTPKLRASGGRIGVLQRVAASSGTGYNTRVKTATILVVDDDRALREGTAGALRAAGYEVLEAGSGSSALALLEDHTGKLELLLTDVQMAN